MEAALRSRLLDAAAIANAVKRRVDWEVPPQAGKLPAIVLTMLSDPRPQHMGGMQATRDSLVRADVWGDDQAEVAMLREAVVETLVPAATAGEVRFLRSFVTALRSLPERTETGVRFRAQIELRVWHIA